MVQVPLLPVSVTTPLFTVHTPPAVNVTDKFDVAVATTVNCPSVTTLLANGPKLIVCVALLTVNEPVALPARYLLSLATVAVIAQVQIGRAHV